MFGGKSDGRWLIPVALIAAVAAFTFLFATHASVFGGSESPPAPPAAQAHNGSVEKDAVTPEATPTTQPSLLEILQAADALAKAGLIPTPVPAPTEVPLIEILQAADALAKAGALPQPAPTQVPLIDILRAADALAKAGALPGQSQPQAPIAPPPASAPLPPATATPLPPAPAQQPGSDGWYDYTYIGRVWDLINQQRVRAGLPPVTKESRLTLAATSYARVLSDQHWFSHTGPDGSTLVSRIEGAGFPFNVPIGEILAWGTQAWPADAMVQAWMDSPTHREEILSGEYTRAGLSCYFVPDAGVTVHCVMDFAG